MAEPYSHSRLSSFEDCPRKFEYRYVLKLPSDTESIEAFVGKRVHEVLERLYEFAGRGALPSLPRVLWRYRQMFEEHHDPKRVRIVRTENPVEFYRDLGERCIINYYRAHYPFDADETIGLEEHIVFELGGGHKIRGFIDRLVRARDGAVEIHDYKTGARVPSQAKLDQDRQLALYQLGLSERFRGPMRLVWHFLRQGITRVSTRTDEQLDDLSQNTLDLIERIEDTSAFPPKTGPLCRWCEYQDRCDAFAGPRARPTSVVDLPEVTAAPRAIARASGRPAAASDQLALPLAGSPPTPVP